MFEYNQGVMATLRVQPPLRHWLFRPGDHSRTDQRGAKFERESVLIVQSIITSPLTIAVFASPLCAACIYDIAYLFASEDSSVSSLPSPRSMSRRAHYRPSPPRPHCRHTLNDFSPPLRNRSRSLPPHVHHHGVYCPQRQLRSLYLSCLRIRFGLGLPSRISWFNPCIVQVNLAGLLVLRFSIILGILWFYSPAILIHDNVLYDDQNLSLRRRHCAHLLAHSALTLIFCSPAHLPHPAPLLYLPCHRHAMMSAFSHSRPLLLPQHVRVCIDSRHHY